MKFNKIETAIGIGFTVIVSVVAWLFYATYLSNQAVLQVEREIDRTYDIMGKVRLVWTALLDAETGTRGYIISGDEAYLSTYIDGKAKLAQYLAVVKEHDWEGKSVQITELEGKSNIRISKLDQLVQTRKVSGFEAAREKQKTIGSRQAMDEVRSLIAQIVDDEQLSLKRRIEASETNAQKAASAFVLTGTLLSFALAGIGIVIFSQTAALKKTSAQLTVENEERKLAEIKLTRSNEELQQFAYVASHDLQEPLRAVAGFLMLLEKRYKGKLDDKADQWINHSVEGAHRMQALIQDLLLLSRVETKGEAFKPVEVAEVLKIVQDNLQTSIAETNATVKTTQRMPKVLADQSQLVQLFQNLIANGIKFRSSETAPAISITADYDEGQKMWKFAVKDNGIGFDIEHADRIFQMFQRLQTRTMYAGTGIGLAVCKKIVERHGGLIWAESEPGKGSTFLFTLPATTEERQ